MALGNNRGKMADFTRSEHRARVLWSGTTFGRNTSGNVACGQNTMNSVPCVSQHVLLQLGPLCSLNLTKTDSLFPRNCTRKCEENLKKKKKIQTIPRVVQANNLR